MLILDPLRPDRVDVWLVPLEASGDRLEALLSSDERERMERFRLARDQERFAIARGTLRVLLGEALDMPPEAVRLDYGPKGKPHLKDAPVDVRFNVSHSGGLALVAMTLGREVGVDLEQCRPVEGAAGIARRHFLPSEAALGEEAFLAVWTRKEAVLKASGSGLANGLSRVEVGARPLGETCQVTLPSHDEWTVVSFEPLEGYIAALAAEGTAWTPALRRLP